MRRAKAFRSHSNYEIIKRPGDVRDWQVKCVCEATCNNGWMSRLENRARPILIPLIKGEPARLTPEQQVIVAGWAAMKAMVGEHGSQSSITTHHTQRKRMMARQLPPKHGWGVWIGYYERKRWVPSWVAHPMLILPEKQARQRPGKTATYNNSQVTTYIVGKLFMQVMRSPMPNLIQRWRFAPPDGGFLARIWPPTSTSLLWPSATMTDRDADYAAGALFRVIQERSDRQRQSQSAIPI